MTHNRLKNLSHCRKERYRSEVVLYRFRRVHLSKSIQNDRLCLSVCLSVCPSIRPVRGCTLFTFAPSYERTSKIEKLRFSLMGQRHVGLCTFRHAHRAAYRTAISAAQILVILRLPGYLGH